MIGARGHALRPPAEAPKPTSVPGACSGSPPPADCRGMACSASATTSDEEPPEPLLDPAAGGARALFERGVHAGDARMGVSNTASAKLACAPEVRGRANDRNLHQSAGPAGVV